MTTLVHVTQARRKDDNPHPNQPTPSHPHLRPRHHPLKRRRPLNTRHPRILILAIHLNRRPPPLIQPQIIQRATPNSQQVALVQDGAGAPARGAAVAVEVVVHVGARVGFAGIHFRRAGGAGEGGLRDDEGEGAGRGGEALAVGAVAEGLGRGEIVGG